MKREALAAVITALVVIAVMSAGTVRAYINGDYEEGFSHE